MRYSGPMAPARRARPLTVCWSCAGDVLWPATGAGPYVLKTCARARLWPSEGGRGLLRRALRDSAADSGRSTTCLRKGKQSYFAISSILLTVIREHCACAMFAHSWKLVRRLWTRGGNVSSGRGSARRLPKACRRPGVAAPRSTRIERSAGLFSEVSMRNSRIPSPCFTGRPRARRKGCGLI